MASKVYCFGEVLWDAFKSGKKPGGAPLNVAFHAHNLGMDVALVSAVGADNNGLELRHFVAHSGLSTKWLQTKDHIPTGTVSIDDRDIQNVKYTINQPAAWDFITVSEQLVSSIESADFVVFGSLAARNATSRNALLSLLKSPATKIFDVNLRAPFYNKALVEKLLKAADWVKVNEEEFGILANWFKISAGLESGATLLSELFAIKKLLVTKGSKGAFLWDENRALQSEIYTVSVKDTVGAGDAFLAGFLAGFQQRKNMQTCLNEAAALGAMVAERVGATPIISKNAWNAFLETNTK